MSLILEALRKSEAERRRGAAPDVHAELAPLPDAARRRWPRWWPLLPALLAGAVVAGLLAWPREPGPPATGPDDARGAPAGGARTPSRVRTATPGSAERAPGAERRATVATARLPPVDRLQPPPVLPAPAAGGPEQPDADAGPVAVDAPGGQPAPAIGRATASPPRTAAEVAPLPSSTAPQPAMPPPRPAPPGDMPTVAELPADERGQLPPMKLTLHLWNEDPARRFVILDGDRHVEGDRVGSARIASIDGDGVVLELNGRRVRLPLR